MALSLNAYKVLSGALADQQNANTASYDAIMRKRDAERQYLMDRLKWETALGETERDNIRQQLDNGFGIGGVVRNMLGMGKKNHNLNTDSSLFEQQSQQLSPEEEQAIPKLNAQQEILQQLKQEYAGDTVGYNDALKRISLGVAKQSGIDGQATRNTPFADKVMANAGIKRNEEAIQKAELKRQEAMAKKKLDSGDHYKQVLDERGIILPRELRGKFADQTGQLEQAYGAVIDEAIRLGRWDDARKFNREFVTNMKSVYKSWNEDPRGIQSLFSEEMIPKSKGTGGKPKLYTLKTTFMRDGEQVTGTRKVLLTDDEASNLYGANTRKKLLNAGFSEDAITNTSLEIVGGDTADINKGVQDEKEAMKYDKAYKIAMKGGGEYNAETGEVKIAGVSFFPPVKNYDYKVKQQKALESE